MVSANVINVAKCGHGVHSSPKFISSQVSQQYISATHLCHTSRSLEQCQNPHYKQNSKKRFQKQYRLSMNIRSLVPMAADPAEIWQAAALKCHGTASQISTRSAPHNTKLSNGYLRILLKFVRRPCGIATGPALKLQHYLNPQRQLTTFKREATLITGVWSNHSDFRSNGLKKQNTVELQTCDWK